MIIAQTQDRKILLSVFIKMFSQHFHCSLNWFSVDTLTIVVIKFTREISKSLPCLHLAGGIEMTQVF